MIEADFNGGPIRAERETVRPLDNHDGLFGQGVLQAERFEVMKAFYAVEIDVVDLARRRARLGALEAVIAELMDEIESGTRDVFFLGRAQAADDSLGGWPCRTDAKSS